MQLSVIEHFLSNFKTVFKTIFVGLEKKWFMFQLSLFELFYGQFVPVFACILLVLNRSLVHGRVAGPAVDYPDPAFQRRKKTDINLKTRCDKIKFTLIFFGNQCLKYFIIILFYYNFGQ